MIDAERATGRKGMADIAVFNRFHNTRCSVRVPLGRIYSETTPAYETVTPGVWEPARTECRAVLTEGQWYSLRRRLCGQSDCLCMRHGSMVGATWQGHQVYLLHECEL